MDFTIIFLAANVISATISTRFSSNSECNQCIFLLTILRLFFSRLSLVVGLFAVSRSQIGAKCVCISLLITCHPDQMIGIQQIWMKQPNCFHIITVVENVYQTVAQCCKKCFIESHTHNSLEIGCQLLMDRQNSSLRESERERGKNNMLSLQWIFRGYFNGSDEMWKFNWFSKMTKDSRINFGFVLQFNANKRTKDNVSSH